MFSHNISYIEKALLNAEKNLARSRRRHSAPEIIAYWQALVNHFRALSIAHEQGKRSAPDLYI